MDDSFSADLSADDLGIGVELIPPEVTGRQLLCARILLGVTQQQVAKRLAISRASVRRAEGDYPGSRRTRRQMEGMLRRNGIVFEHGGVRPKRPLEVLGRIPSPQEKTLR
jgi:hypothetical protein